jgi:hypothetical protein
MGGEDRMKMLMLMVLAALVVALAVLEVVGSQSVPVIEMNPAAW